MRRVVHSVTACLLILTGLTFSPLAQPETALADNTRVTTCNEPSFDAALTAVQNSGGGTITFDCNGTISFANQKDITSDVTIAGNGAVVFDGGGATRHFQVDSGARLAVFNLTLQNGGPNSIAGGAILNNGGIVEVTASTFTNNNPLRAGAIYNNIDGTLTITASTFSGNSASRSGGAIDNSGGALTIAGSTFSGNSANQDFAAETISTAGGSATIGSSILAHSGDPSDSGVNCIGTLTSTGYNLSNDTSCEFSNTDDLQGEDVTINLGPLQDNGSPTHTMLPEEGSEAIEAIPAAVCLDVSTTTDQRGIPRPQGDCEIGAVELGQGSESVSVCANPYTGELSMQPEQGCPSGMTELSLPSVDPVTLCIAAYTGTITWTPTGNCTGDVMVHIIPDDGPLDYCQSVYTGRLRYSDTGACTSYEIPGVIPGRSIVD